MSLSVLLKWEGGGACQCFVLAAMLCGMEPYQ